MMRPREHPRTRQRRGRLEETPPSARRKGMSVRIEEASSGQSKCKFCDESIAKGELRFAEDVAFTAVDNATTNHFYHLKHAAQSRPAEFIAALKSFRHRLPDRSELEAAADAAQQKIETFVASPEWERNDRGNLTLKGSQPVA